MTIYELNVIANKVSMLYEDIIEIIGEKPDDMSEKAMWHLTMAQMIFTEIEPTREYPKYTLVKQGRD